MFNLYDKIITNFNDFIPNIIGLNKSKYFDYTASGLAYNTIEQRILRVLQTRAGCSCAGPYGHDLLGIDKFDITKKPGWLRISLHYSHLESDIDFLVSSLKDLTNY